MSRITISLAEDITRSLLAKKRTDLEILRGELSSKIIAHIRTLLPKEVVELYENKKDFHCYLKMDSSVYLNGTGLNRDYVPLHAEYPMPNGRSVIIVEGKIAEEFSSSIMNIKNLDKEISILRYQIKNTLLELRTFKKVEEFFPEATPYLPRDTKSVNLPVNLSELRSKIK